MSESKIRDIQLQITVLFIKVKIESVFRKELRAHRKNIIIFPHTYAVLIVRMFRLHFKNV